MQNCPETLPSSPLKNHRYPDCNGGRQRGKFPESFKEEEYILLTEMEQQIMSELERASHLVMVRFTNKILRELFYKQRL